MPYKTYMKVKQHKRLWEELSRRARPGKQDT